MMFQILNKIPRKIFVAVSGGIDSMVALDFLSKNHDVTVAFFNHNTKTSRLASEFLQDTLTNIPIVVECINRSKDKDESWEEYWRIERYKFFHALSGPVVTAHHLDDAVETWVWTSCHGNPRLIPYANKNVIRPFLLNPKSEFEDWATRHDVKWIDDLSNFDVSHMRNYIRHITMPHIRVLNPGIQTVIRKKLLEENS